MDEKIRGLLNQITILEDELRTTLHNRETKIFYHIKGKKIEFEHTIRETHLRLKRGILRWIITDRPQNFLTAPFIYSLIFPLTFLDLCVTFYQASCFRIYGIARVKRADYIVFDKQHLGYLNFFERFHCTFCTYANGLIAYTGEIAARTEQYFCPIKHAYKILGSHARYDRFLPYGEAKDYHAKLEAFRIELGQETANPKEPSA